MNQEMDILHCTFGKEKSAIYKERNDKKLSFWTYFQTFRQMIALFSPLLAHTVHLRISLQNYNE